MDDGGNLKKSAWLSVDLDFWLYHESGASYGPIRELSHPKSYSGYQSYASAQSQQRNISFATCSRFPRATMRLTHPAGQVQSASAPTAPLITPEQVEDLDTALMELGDDAMEGFKKYFKIEFLGRLPAAEFDTAVKILAAKKAKKTKETLEWVEREKAQLRMKELTP